MISVTFYIFEPECQKHNLQIYPVVYWCEIPDLYLVWHFILTYQYQLPWEIFGEPIWITWQDFRDKWMKRTLNVRKVSITDGEFWRYVVEEYVVQGGLIVVKHLQWVSDHQRLFCWTEDQLIVLYQWTALSKTLSCVEGRLTNLHEKKKNTAQPAWRSAMYCRQK